MPTSQRPTLARDLRVEAAEVLATRLNNASAARELYGAVLEEDPGHEKASVGLVALLDAAGDSAGRPGRAPDSRQDLARG